MSGTTQTKAHERMIHRKHHAIFNGEPYATLCTGTGSS